MICKSLILGFLTRCLLSYYLCKISFCILRLVLLNAYNVLVENFRLILGLISSHAPLNIYQLQDVYSNLLNQLAETNIFVRGRAQNLRAYSVILKLHLRYPSLSHALDCWREWKRQVKPNTLFSSSEVGTVPVSYQFLNSRRYFSRGRLFRWQNTQLNAISHLPVQFWWLNKLCLKRWLEKYWY